MKLATYLFQSDLLLSSLKTNNTFVGKFLWEQETTAAVLIQISFPPLTEQIL